MSQPRRSSQTQMAALNAQLLDQNAQLKNMTKTAQQTNQVTMTIQHQLGRQRGVIQNNIDITKDTKQELSRADKKTNEMRRRNLCVKGLLWIVAILLFCTVVALIIYKVNTLY